MRQCCAIAVSLCALLVLSAAAFAAEEGDGAGSRAAGGVRPATEAKEGAEKAATRGRPGGTAQEITAFTRADTNKDGKIDKEELAAIEKKSPRLAEILKRADGNNDGVIDEKEMAAATEQMSKARHARTERGQEKPKEGDK